MKLTEEAIKKLRSYPPSKCFKCDSKVSYTNPMEKCFECGQKFCYDHIHALQVNDKMSISETVRDICETCKEKLNYRTL
jgi:hypothetical protein